MLPAQEQTQVLLLFRPEQTRLLSFCCYVEAGKLESDVITVESWNSLQNHYAAQVHIVVVRKASRVGTHDSVTERKANNITNCSLNRKQKILISVYVDY